MSVELHYRKEASALFGSIWRPVAEVLLEGPNGRFTDLFYIDSGADITLIPDEVGIIIGLERKDIQLTQLTGVGGRSIRVHEVKIPLTIGEYIFRDYGIYRFLKLALKTWTLEILDRKPDIFHDFR